MMGKFRGIAGAVTDIYICQNSQLVVTVGVDRKLRIFELEGQRRLVKEVWIIMFVDIPFCRSISNNN
jgi:hypothetical protein